MFNYPPETWEAAEALSNNSDELNRYLRARLVQLTAQDNSVAIRAIEMLMQMADSSESVDLSGMDIHELRRARNRAEAYLVKCLEGGN